MDENGENASPFSASNGLAAGGIGSGPGAGTGTGTTNNVETASPGSQSNTSYSMNGSSTSTSEAAARPASASTGSVSQAQQPTPASQGQSQFNGVAGNAGATSSNSTITGSKALASKRTRLFGESPAAPPFGPLGAASPSHTSNGPSNSSSSASGASSTVSTPSATPTASPSQLSTPLPPPQSAAPPVSSYNQHHHYQNSTNYSAPSAPGSASATTNTHLYPALHLHPLNDTFIPKQISLYPPGPNNRIKIGRQTNAKTVPAPNNGYFDSKVLSRTHAEVWCEGNKVYIKDVKSSNGTFINGERLSPEAVESDIFELHNNDMVEFGIDITSEDQKTIVHHKVAARCFLVMNAEDAIATSRNFANYYRELGDSPMNRRSGMGAGKASMAHAGMNLDQVLNRLQTELQKSRETGADLGTLTSAIGEIHETLGGNIPGPPLPSYRVPPYVPPNPNAPPSPGQIAAQQSQAATQQLLQALQSQLQETQNALNVHVERIRGLEVLLSEQERMKAELKEVKDRMEEARVEWENIRDQKQYNATLESSEEEDEDEKSDDEDPDKGPSEQLDDSDTKTIRLDGGLEDLTSPEDPATRPDKISSTATAAATHEGVQNAVDASAISATHSRLEKENATLAKRMEDLSSELSAASQLSSSLKSQYVQAAETIRHLEEKVNIMEKELQQHRSDSATVANSREISESVPTQTTLSPGATSDNARLPMAEDIIKEVESRFTNWKKSFEEAAKKEREDWAAEREQLRVAVQEWERRSNLFDRANLPNTTVASRKKRRSKASTVGSSSEEDTSDSARDSDQDEGFVSPVTEDLNSPRLEQINEDADAESSKSIPKRPRSRRRRRADGRVTSGSETTGSPSGRVNSVSTVVNKALPEDGGSAPLRRRSWIPFSSNSDAQYGTAESRPPKGIVNGAPDSSKKRYTEKRPDGLVEHPAFPLVSAAGVLVIGYLAYNAILQHQK